MLTRRIARTALELQWLQSSAQLPPTFLLPLRARWISSTPSIIEPRETPPLSEIDPSTYDALEHAASSSSSFSSLIRPPLRPNKQPPPMPRGPPLQPSSATPPAKENSTLPESVKTLLPLLAAQKPHYATIHIHGRPYLVTEGDILRLPFKMQGVSPGDVLRLTCASTLGSRDFTLRGNPHVDARLFVVRAVVAGVESEPMRIMQKTKRRNRKIKTVKSKMRFTELAIREVGVRKQEDVEKGEDV